MATKPINFKRGSTFAASMRVPSSIEDGHFVGWDVKAQARKINNDFDVGFIADLIASWVNPTTTRLLSLQNNQTTNWPLGPAEFDILFISPEGRKVYSNSIKFEIVRGITQSD